MRYGNGRRPGVMMLPFVQMIVIAFSMGVIAPIAANAVVEIDITQGNLKPIPIAIPVFSGRTPGEQKIGRDVADVVTADLARSGLFEPVDRAAFIERNLDINKSPQFRDWRVIRSDALAVGHLSRQRDGRLKAEFRLWDIFAGRQLAGQQYVSDERNWRRMGHLIADAIYQRLTGEKGYFDSRIVFVDETGSKGSRVKRLAIMDHDGHNVRLLTEGRNLVLTPRFSPNHREIAYMSYEGGSPRVLLFNIETGQKRTVGDFPGMTFAPRFSPDGQKIVMSLQRGGDSNIYEMNLRTRRTRPLTNTAAIDTAPCYSADGRQIVFESDRDGRKQLYVMNADGSGQRRISSQGGRYSTPVWSPRGDLIAFTKQLSGRFLIGVMRPDGSGERILTEGYHNEGPTWAPNGRVLMFFRESRGPRGGPRLFTVDLTGYNEIAVPTPAFGSDPAWSPLIN